MHSVLAHAKEGRCQDHINRYPDNCQCGILCRASNLPAVHDDITASPCQVEGSMLANAICTACNKICLTLQAASLLSQTDTLPQGKLKTVHSD